MMETNQQAEELPNVKKPRKRFKKLFAQVQQQMEFYFSDANLNKDRFMTKLVAESESGKIGLDVFMKFNRIKSLCTDEEMLAKALRKSRLLEVNEKSVQRKIPFKPREKTDVDDRTIYVECLPPHADHEMLKKIFSAYGNVLFVSLPKYKSSGDLKNFAFIEFEKKEQAHKAVDLMNSSDVADKAGRFPKMHNKQWQSLQKQADTRTSIDESETARPGKKKRRHASGDSTDGEDGSSAKRPRGIGSEGEEQVGEIPAEGTKKRKRDTSECSEGDSGPIEGQKKGGKDRRRSKEKLQKTGELESDSDGKINLKKVKQETKSGVSGSDTEVRGTKGASESDVEKTEVKGPMKGILKQESREDDAKAKKRKLDEGGSDSDAKRVKIGENVVMHPITEKRKRRHPNRDHRRHEKDPDLNMRVLTKKQWLDLKKEYLNLQKESMKALKKSVQEKKVKSSNPDPAEKGRPAIEFTPNVIIRVKIDPLRMPMTRQQIKERLNPDAIAYVDMNDGDQNGHIRCKSDVAAKLVIESKVDGVNVSLLQGNDETSYWEKITADREQKLNSKRKKKRGAQKVIEKIDRIVAADASKQKHVFFDDD
ncbi:la-related protein 7-like [Lineus longissimus]|uniref:la-related protein 7-like n=1 Tax=Lineus longissimus TaxID=88925 RepID=UPI002B4E1A7F